MAHYLVGQDPLLIERHWQMLTKAAFYRGAILSSAVAGIDQALWDIAGKAHGVPVHELLGWPDARTHARLRVDRRGSHRRLQHRGDRAGGARPDRTRLQRAEDERLFRAQLHRHAGQGRGGGRAPGRRARGHRPALRHRRGLPRPRLARDGQAAAADARAIPAAVRRRGGAAGVSRRRSRSSRRSPRCRWTGERIFSRWEYKHLGGQRARRVAARPVARGWHLRDAAHRSDGRDVRHHHRAALRDRAARAGRLAADRLRDPERADPGAGRRLQATRARQQRRGHPRLPRRHLGVQLRRRLRRPGRPGPGWASRSTKPHWCAMPSRATAGCRAGRRTPRHSRREM